MWTSSESSGSIEFRVETNPVPWQRPRANTRTGAWYVDRKSRDCRRAIQKVARNAGSVHNAFCILRIAIILRRPAKPSYAYPTVGDLDNYVKTVEDSLNGVCFTDDRQVVEIHARKRYAKPGESPGYFVRIDAIMEMS